MSKAWMTKQRPNMTLNSDERRQRARRLALRVCRAWHVTM